MEMSDYEALDTIEDELLRPSTLSPQAGVHQADVTLASRLLLEGVDALADWEVVRLVLKGWQPSGDMDAIARTLVSKFGSLSGIVTASAAQLRAVDGIGPSEVATLRAVHVVALRLIKSKLVDRPLLRCWNSLAEYLTAVLSHESVEQVRVLFLNRRSFLLADEIHCHGTVGHVSAYPREIVKRALELNSSLVILAHNHPGGDPTPSKDDIEMTMKVLSALRTVDIVLHDHVIIAKGATISFRRRGIIPFSHLSQGESYGESRVEQKRGV